MHPSVSEQHLRPSVISRWRPSPRHSTRSSSTSNNTTLPITIISSGPISPVGTTRWSTGQCLPNSLHLSRRCDQASSDRKPRTSVHPVLSSNPRVRVFLIHSVFDRTDPIDLQITSVAIFNKCSADLKTPLYRRHHQSHLHRGAIHQQRLNRLVARRRPSIPSGTHLPR